MMRNMIEYCQIRKQGPTFHPKTQPVRSEVFPFFQLPGEIRHEIYSRYIGWWNVIIEYESQSETFKLRGPPAYPILLASRSIYLECAQIVSQRFSGRLIVRDTKICRKRSIGFISPLDIIGSLVPKWLLENTRFLTIEQGTTGMLMMLPWFKLKSLQEINLEASLWPVASCRGCGVPTQLQETQENDALEGKYDTWCIHGFNKWSQVPEQVSQGHVRVVTVRKGLVKGVFLTVRVEHRRESAEVLDRTMTSRIRSVDGDSGEQDAKERIGLSCHPM